MSQTVYFGFNKIPNISERVEELVCEELGMGEIIEKIVEEQGAVFKVILKDDLRLALKILPSKYYEKEYWMRESVGGTYWSDFEKAVDDKVHSKSLSKLLKETHSLTDKDIRALISIPSKYRIDKKSNLLYLNKTDLKEYVNQFVRVEKITV